MVVHWYREKQRFFLEHEEMDGDRILFAARLMPIYDHERDLMSGRFAKMRPQPLSANEVVIEQPRGGSTDEYLWFERYINWIAEHTSGFWGVKVNMVRLNLAKMTFSFENDTDAVVFKLVWS